MAGHISEGQALKKYCLICGKESTGNHYGCQACHCCKGFFRRAILDGIKPTCSERPTCSEKSTHVKSWCRPCRYRKCLDEGMDPAALKAPRDKIGKRERRHCSSASRTDHIDNRCVESTTSPLTAAPMTATFSMLELVSELTANDKALRARKSDYLRARSEARRLLQPSKLLKNVAGADDVRDVTEAELVTMIEWAHSLPFFGEINAYDQQTLLRRSAVHHILLEHCFYTAQHQVDDLLFYTNGSFMPRRMALLPDEVKRTIPSDRRWRQDQLYAKSTAQCIDQVVVPLRRLRLAPEELVLLKILLLLSGVDQPCELSKDTKRKLIDWRNRVILSLFQVYASKNQRNPEERFGNLLLSLSGIAASATGALECYQMLRLFEIVSFDQMAEQLLFDTTSD